MPAYPVGRGGIMLNGAAAPASAIINNGPGLLYLYRNSAVSAYAYDTIIGPSGSFQWPGGELWAASDAGTTVNVLAGLSSFDSGTTTVAGTVATTAGSVSFSQKGIAGGDVSAWTATAGATDVIVRAVVTCTTMPRPVTNVGGFSQTSGGGTATGEQSWNSVIAKYPCGFGTVPSTGPAGVSGGLQVEWGYFDGAAYQLLTTAFASDFRTHNFPGNTSSRAAIGKVSVAGPFVRVRCVPSYPALVAPFVWDTTVVGVPSSTSVTASDGAGTIPYPRGSTFTLTNDDRANIGPVAAIWGPANTPSVDVTNNTNINWRFNWAAAVPYTGTYRSGSGGLYTRNAGSTYQFYPVSGDAVLHCFHFGIDGGFTGNFTGVVN